VLVADDMPANVELLRRLLTARIHGRDWRGHPLVNYEPVVKLIGATKTRTGLRVKAVLDTGTYQKGLKSERGGNARGSAPHALERQHQDKVEPGTRAYDHKRPC